MGALNDVRAELAGKLSAAGVSTSTDPRAVAPFVLVGSPTVIGGAGVGGWTVDYPIHVVASPPGNADALDWMLAQLELVLRTLGPTSASPGLYGDKDAPAYELRYRRDVTNPDC